MNSTEVESLVHAVIIQYGLPFSILSVVGSPAGWNVMVRTQTGGIVRFTVADGRPIDMRTTIQDTLEARF